MSYCLNPQCQKPRNPDGTKFCISCGLRLLLGDRYRAIKLLSQGGFGRTFLAIDECKPSKPYCAIKQFFPQNQSTDSAKKAAEMFRCEAMRLEELGHHPQIAELLAYFEQDNRQYLVQEYIEGQNLAAQLAAQGAFNETQIRELLNDLLLVLRFVHEHNIIHRDIKPSNIIRRSCDRQLVLVDFGAAKLTTDLALELTGTIIGSAGYTPPEQLLGKAVFASDLYSLGVTCIHLMTQTHPMNLFDVYEGTWVWRQYLKHPVSDELGQILDKLLERTTKQRYQSIEVVLNDLNSYPIETDLSLLNAPTILAQSCDISTQTWKYVGTVFGHSTRVLAVAISPNGKTLASSSQNGTIKLWSLESGKALPSRTLSKGSDAVQSIAFSPNGEILVSSDRHGNIKFWQVETGELKSSFCGHLSPIQSIVISADGQIIASAGDNKNIKIWRYSNQELLYTFNGHCHVNSIALTPNSKILASGCQDGTIKLWSLKTGRLIQTLEWPSGAVYALAFSPDGKVLAAGGHGSKIHFWDIETGELIETLVSNLGSVRSLIFSPDGETLASGGEDSTIKFWHWKTGQLISSCPHHFQLVSSLAFSPDSRLLASGSHDKSIKLWKLSD
ncbi:MAG TPA: serine/threonine protein kinase [Cyanobacteria bacterium UBA11372]|nr:serine/threonine protein kinase [Cyanobacteria bacterium UBA11372]